MSKANRACGPKTRKWVVTTLKAMYLVYGDEFAAKNSGKSWNAINYFVKDQRRATRFKDERDAQHAIILMNIYLRGAILLCTKEIWE